MQVAFPTSFWLAHPVARDEKEFNTYDVKLFDNVFGAPAYKFNLYTK